MSASIVHNDTIVFNGTNYLLWRNCLLCKLRTLCPHIEQFLDVGFSPPMDSQNLSLEDEKNLHLEAQVSNELLFSLRPDFRRFLIYIKRKSSHEMWIKLKEMFGGSIFHLVGGVSEEISSPSHHEELQVASTSGRDELSSSSTSPTCSKTRGNDMVSGEENCNVDIVLNSDDSSSLSHCNASSLDLNTSSIENNLHACVDSPCISCVNCLHRSHEDMLALSCSHNQNVSISSSCLLTNIVEETEHSMDQDMISNEDSRISSSSSSGMHMCLMANGSKVSPTLTPNTSSNDESDDDDNDEEYNTLVHNMAMVYASLHGNKEARANLEHSMDTLNKYRETIVELESHVENGEMRFTLLKHELKDEKHTNFMLTQKIESYMHENEKTIVDACATNSNSCEASTLKENVELRAQLELLTSNYRELEESHKKLSGSHDDLLISYDGLKLAHEASITKVTSCEPHMDVSTISTTNVILPCASPCNPSSQTSDTPCVGLLTLPCCSNNEASTSSSTCISTNHVEEIKEIEAQVLSLKKDLEKRHEGKSALDKMLSVQQSPNDKSGLGFNSNNKNKSKSKSNKKKGQDKVKDPAKLVCFKCKVEGHHVRSCPLKKKKHLSEKQQGKRPQGQGQAHARPQVEDRPLPKKNQDIVPQEKKSIKKRKGNTCYLCREKGHFASSCLGGTLSNPIIVDDDYSLGKDKDGNVFAKFVGTQSGFKKRTIWVAKPIVTNLLGPNLVGDQQSQT